MRLQNWFIRNLDDYQRQVIIEGIDKSIIVQGVAGSGKTNLAIHRALQAKNEGSYAIVVLTIALKRMIAYGMETLGLNKERIAYKWSWSHRGFDLTGDVYREKEKINKVYLVNDTDIRQFELVSNPDHKRHYGIDFANWVDYKFYRAWRRRESWFQETYYDNQFDITNEKYELVPSGILYKQHEDKIDYIIIDEAQDFETNTIIAHFIPHVRKSLSLLGDSKQLLSGDKGSSIDKLRKTFQDYKPFDLVYNYRLPKTIAKVAQNIQVPPIDLVTHNMKDGGNSDYPNYPKPIIKKCMSHDDELKWIVNKIKIEDLDDVGILVHNKDEVPRIIKYFADNGIKVMTHYTTGNTPPFQTVNTLDFSNNELPCILDYFSAKGTEFENVFIPFANKGNVGSRNHFFVACTRSSHSLYITYSGNRTTYLDNIDKKDIEEL